LADLPQDRCIAGDVDLAVQVLRVGAEKIVLHVAVVTIGLAEIVPIDKAKGEGEVAPRPGSGLGLGDGGSGSGRDLDLNPPVLGLAHPAGRRDPQIFLAAPHRYDLGSGHTWRMSSAATLPAHRCVSSRPYAAEPNVSAWPAG